jgi:uncharacterized protein (TIGR00725 family)
MEDRLRLVAIVGDGTAVRADAAWRLAETLGERLVDEGYRVLTGGLGGVMEAASLGAHRSGGYAPGCVVGLLPGSDVDGANPYVDVALATGLGHLRNALVAQAEAVVALGGGAGTLSEMALAWIHRRLLVGYRLPGWSGKLADTQLDDRPRFSSVADDRVFGVETAEDVLELLRIRLPQYAVARSLPR